MKNKLLNIGILLLPSVRSMAYMNVFRQLDIFPKEIILLDGNVPELPRLKAEDNIYKYSEWFFDLNYDLIKEIEKSNSNVIKLGTKDINSLQVHQALKKCQSEYFIFTGGGILSELTLAQGKRFIHSHSGLIPEYRGSTCFYYSILADNSLASTSIIMTHGIDTGPVVALSNFEINYYIRQDQPLFMDYIVDPYIRSITLKKVLLQYLNSGEITFADQTTNKGPNYYVMHPLLRHLAINVINKRFNPGKPSGIFEVN